MENSENTDDIESTKPETKTDIKTTKPDKTDIQNNPLSISFKKIESALKPAIDKDENNIGSDKKEDSYNLNSSILPSTIEFIFKIVAKLRRREDIIPMLLLTESDKQLVNDGLKSLIERILAKYHILAWQFEAIVMMLAIFVPRIIIIMDNPPKKEIQTGELK